MDDRKSSGWKPNGLVIFVAWIAVVTLISWLTFTPKPHHPMTFTRCADGGLTTSIGRGTCSSHGGIG